MSNWRVSDVFANDGSVFFRVARKQHRCCGGHDGKENVKCLEPIAIGSKYVEYVGESPSYQSGYRYHLECANQQGLVREGA